MTQKELKALEQLNEFALTESEETGVLGIFDYMYANEGLLQKYDTDNVDVMVHVMEMTNVLRDDVSEQKFSRDDLLSGAPEHTQDSWQVPRLVK